MKKQTVAGLPCDERVLRADGGQSAPQVRDMGAQGDVSRAGGSPRHSASAIRLAAMQPHTTKVSMSFHAA
jgi:hypothetical protein